MVKSQANPTGSPLFSRDQALLPLSGEVDCDEILDTLKCCDETATVTTNDLGVTHIRCSG